MNPDTNKFEKIFPADLSETSNNYEKILEATTQLFRADGTPVPKTWSTFQEGENVVIKDYTFKVAHIGESYIVFEPIGLIKIGQK